MTTTQHSEKPNRRSVRILHTSDWQIGMKRRFLPDEAQNRFDEARLDAVEQIFDLARERDCDAVVVAGDVFDDNTLYSKTWARITDVLRNASVPTYLLPGNHDPFNAGSIFRKPEFVELAPSNGGNVIVLQDSEPRQLAPGIEIIGAPLLSKTANEDLVAAAVEGLEPSADGIRIIVGHGATEGFGSDGADVIDVAHLSDLARRRVVDYVALGDTHSSAVLDDGPADRGVVRYSGSPEVTDFLEPDGGGESRSGYALIVDIEIDPNHSDQPAQVAVEEVKVGRWKFLAKEASVYSQEDLNEFIADLEAIDDRRSTVIKYSLSGTLDPIVFSRYEMAIEQLKDRFAALYERERLMDLHLSPDFDSLREHLQLRGYPANAMESLLDRVQYAPEDSEEAKDITNALLLLIQFASNIDNQEA